MSKRSDLREQIIETSYYLTQSIITPNLDEIDRLRDKLNELITLYKTTLNE